MKAKPPVPKSRSFIVRGGLVLAAVLLAGCYDAVPGHEALDSVWRINRLTGEVCRFTRPQGEYDRVWGNCGTMNKRAE